ncbi:MAG: glycosyltransferase family 2 protein [Pleurocapsa sp.]
MTDQKLSELVSIGITTKNRWQDLEKTLTKIVEVGLGYLPIIIFDDGSDISCPFDLNAFDLAKIELKRFEHSQGLIVRRNQLAEVIKTKYYFSLDDDSYPVVNSLAAAVAFANTKEDLFCLSFPIYNPVQNRHENSSDSQQPYQVRSFVGCGHLLHRDRFLILGGYREELVHQGEEMEVAARAFQKNLYCYHFPDFLVHHTASNEGRSWWRMDFYGSRNNVLWNDWFVPNNLKLIKQTRTLVSRLLLSLKVRRLGLIQGEIAGFRDIMRYQNNRHTKSFDIFNQWQDLPHN